MWDRTLKTNEQTRKQEKTHRHRQHAVVTRGKVVGGKGHPISGDGR